MPKIRFHYLFLILAIALFLIGKVQILICSVLVALLHEIGHAVAAKNRGYVMEKITLMPYGAILKGGENFTPKDNLIIALAGPCVNLFLCLIFISLWWLFPITYEYTLLFVEVNVTILLFNLLPAFPLDGARIIIGLYDNKFKSLKILRTSGLIISFIIFAVFIVSAFFEINLSIGIMAVFLAFGSLSGTKKEMYIHVSKNLPFTKNYKQPMEVSVYNIQQDVQLFKIIKLIKANKICTFKIYDGSKLVKIIEEKDLEEIITGCDLKLSFKDILKKI